MTPDNHNLDHEVEQRLARIPAPAPSARLHADLRRQVLEEFDRSVNPLPAETPWQRIIQKGVSIMSHPISRVAFGLAAVLLLAIWLVAPGPSIAFGDFLAPIVNAKSAKFKMVVKNDVPASKEISATGYYLVPHRFRQEIRNPDGSHSIAIADFDRGRMLSLTPDKKEAVIFEIKGKPADKKVSKEDLFGNLRAALDEYRKNKTGQLDELAEKDIDGRRAFGFRLSAGGFVQTLWGDVATGRLIRIESTYNGPPKMEVVMSDIEFDVPLEVSLFAIEPPAGYKTTTIPIDAAPPTEQDFIASLRRLSDATDGEFPASLDTPGIAGAMVKLLKGKESQELMTEGVALGRGLQFAVSQPADADAHYAGKGVKRTSERAPIFWYKPAGSQKYRVVWSDLTAGESDKAPDVPGAIRLNEDLTKPKGK
jgi:outer membrane lipoprotein-sorting protein